VFRCRPVIVSTAEGRGDLPVRNVCYIHPDRMHRLRRLRACVPVSRHLRARRSAGKWQKFTAINAPSGTKRSNHTFAPHGLAHRLSTRPNRSGAAFLALARSNQAASSPSFDIKRETGFASSLRASNYPPLFDRPCGSASLPCFLSAQTPLRSHGSYAGTLQAGKLNCTWCCI